MSWTSRIVALLAVAGVAVFGWLLLAGPAFLTYDRLPDTSDLPSAVANARGGTEDYGGTTYTKVDGDWYEKRTVECAAVLRGLPSDHPDKRAAAARKYSEDVPARGEVAEDNPRRDEGREGDDWIATDCGRARQQRLGVALAVALPTLVFAGYLAVVRLRRTISASARAASDRGWSDLVGRARGERDDDGTSLSP